METLKLSLLFFPLSQLLNLLASLGVTQFEPNEDNPDKSLAGADDAIYAAKQAGRKRVVSG